MEQSSLRVRQAFTEAADHVVELVGSIGDDQWDQPAIGEWTLAELVVHTVGGASRVTTYAAEPAERTLAGAADYYVAALSSDNVHEAVTQRARDAAVRVEGPLADFAASEVAMAEQVLARTPANAVLGTFAGGIRLIDYLPTRVVELVVHAIDISGVLGREPAIPRVAMEVTLETLADIAVARPEVVDPATIVRALTGRGELPQGANLLR